MKLETIKASMSNTLTWNERFSSRAKDLSNDYDIEIDFYREGLRSDDECFEVYVSRKGEEFLVFTFTARDFEREECNLIRTGCYNREAIIESLLNSIFDDINYELSDEGLL